MQQQGLRASICLLQLLYLSLHMWHWSFREISSTKALKSGVPCRSADWHSRSLLVSPFNLSPVSHNNPSPADLHWQVEVAMGCPWPPLNVGADVGLDQTRSDLTHSVCVLEPKRATGIRKVFLRFLFSQQWTLWVSSLHPVRCAHIFRQDFNWFVIYMHVQFVWMPMH